MRMRNPMKPGVYKVTCVACNNAFHVKIVDKTQPVPPVPQPEPQPAPQPAQRLAQQPAPKPATQPALKPQPAPQYATQPAPQSKSKNQSEEGSLLEEIKKNPKNLILYSEIMRPKFKEF